MLTANKLEKIMELEDNLRSEYQGQLDAKTAEIESCATAKEELQATIARQLQTITDLSEKATANQRVEQLNRELTNRTEKLQEEATDTKKRVKTLQKDLSEERAETKTLKQYDPARMKKNLDANKKKLTENQSANDMLQKSLNKTKGEKAELERKVKELEAQLAELQPEETPEEEVEVKEEAAA